MSSTIAKRFSASGVEYDPFELKRLISLTRQHDQMQERWCNDTMSDRTRKCYEIEEQVIMAGVERIVQRIAKNNEQKWSVRFDGDPRGYTVTLIREHDGHEFGID